jgi:hypothetical protein
MHCRTARWLGQVVLTGLGALTLLGLVSRLGWWLGYRVWRMIGWLSTALGVAPGPGLTLGLTLLTLVAACLLAGFVVGRAVPGWRGPWGPRAAGAGSAANRTPPVPAAGGLPSHAATLLIELNEVWQPGVLVERSISGMCVVFVPASSPAGTGAVYVVPPAKTLPLNMPLRELTESLRHGGQGISGHMNTLFDAG